MFHKMNVKNGSKDLKNTHKSAAIVLSLIGKNARVKQPIDKVAELTRQVVGPARAHRAVQPGCPRQVQPVPAGGRCWFCRVRRRLPESLPPARMNNLSGLWQSFDHGARNGSEANGCRCRFFPVPAAVLHVAGTRVAGRAARTCDDELMSTVEDGGGVRVSLPEESAHARFL